MKKIFKRLLTGTLCLAMAGMLAMGCTNAASSSSASSTAEDQSNETEETTAAEATISITFMDGKDTLGSIEAVSGKIVDSSAYSAYETKEDYEFLGWYETPTFLESSKKDLASATFTEDTTLYGSFKKTNVTADTRKWYLAGTSSSGPLKDNNWAGNISDELKESFELKATGDAVNEFEITIDLFEGDQFQVIHDWSWDGQKGFGCFTEIDETQFESGGSLGGSANTANVNVLVSGNYTITLTTDPDNSALDTLSITINK